ncbi:hypothetical protein SLS56_004797 [Neofusicoccum ribis]|uniref:Uncharacterized protein n=1 Tax=Neofusicoccum ribis TaxID=45134 RepID=A0ABR3SW20_9PEZI
MFFFTCLASALLPEVTRIVIDDQLSGELHKSLRILLDDDDQAINLEGTRNKEIFTVRIPDNAKHPFAIKIYVGGVNAVSGEPKKAAEATRMEKLARNKPIQDYVVTPQRLWLDGICSEDGNVW